jgi:hypothetical protein
MSLTVYPADKLDAALADPALEDLPAGPGRDLLAWLLHHRDTGYLPVELVIRQQEEP